MKLEIMRYKLKNEELEKNLSEKNGKLKEMTETLSSLQKKELDIKYMKEEIENKEYTIKMLEESIKSLTKDNNELKSLQSSRSQSEQEAVRSLKEELEKVKKDL